MNRDRYLYNLDKYTFKYNEMYNELSREELEEINSLEQKRIWQDIYRRRRENQLKNIGKNK